MVLYQKGCPFRDKTMLYTEQTQIKAVMSLRFKNVLISSFDLMKQEMY